MSYNFTDGYIEMPHDMIEAVFLTTNHLIFVLLITINLYNIQSASK